MFEDNIIDSDKNMCAFPYSDTMSAEDKIKMRQWFGLVQEYHYFKTVSKQPTYNNETE
jgi:hypothetical protein